MNSISQAADYTLRFINQTHRSVFLTGKAGTGKTTLLKKIIETTHKRTVVVAPTGIAALNAGGVTIHSMFQLPFGAFIPEKNVQNQISATSKFESKDTLLRHFRMSGQKKAVIQGMELLIIDEVSMLRADMLDAIDFTLQTVRKKKQPFGGVQVLFIGDLMQLPPVVREDEWRVLRNYYSGKFFFHAQVLQQFPPLYIELTHIYRQTDVVFIDLLNNLRNNKITQENVQFLNQYVNPNFDLKSNSGYITLTTHNHKADQINVQSLADLKGNSSFYKAEITADFPEKIFPIEENLELKVGAQIMFIKNDASPEKRYFNGKMGIVKSISDKEIWINFPEENRNLEVEKHEWQNIKYSVNAATKEIEEEVLGSFVQYPIKLAWAITVHKSQGLTFDKAALDVSQVFMPGQAYVALSRLRSLNGMVLLSPLRMNGISSDADVMQYAENKASEEILESSLAEETKGFIANYLKESFNWNALVQEWRNFQYSFVETDKKNPSKHLIWAKDQTQKIDELNLFAQKFIAQINILFSKNPVDFNFICERVDAAYDYFYSPLDKIMFELLWKMEEVIRMKKTKQIYQDLLVIDDLQTKTILQLMKAKKLIEVVKMNKEISKENLRSVQILDYKAKLNNQVHLAYKESNLTLVEEEIDVERYSDKKKTKKEPKVNTVEVTLELWLQKQTVEQIAETRKLTPTTINNHFAKLIEAKKVAISEFLSKKQLAELSVLFKDFEGESVSPIKEIVGEKFSWEELKMYKASLVVSE